jgi:hypothetical protein
MVVTVPSPFRIDHITPFFAHIPKSTMTKFTDNFVDVAPAFTLFFLVIWWGDATFESEQKKHRS